MFAIGENMKKLLILTLVFAGLSLQASMTPEQAAAQQQAKAEQARKDAMSKYEATLKQMRTFHFYNSTLAGYHLKINYKGNNCPSQDIMIYPATGSQNDPYTVSKAFHYGFAVNKSCCMTDFKLVYIPGSAKGGFWSKASNKPQTWYSKSNLNDGNGICKNTTFNIVPDNNAEHGIRVDW